MNDMDIVDGMGVSKLSASVFKVNYSFNICEADRQEGLPTDRQTETYGRISVTLFRQHLWFS